MGQHTPNGVTVGYVEAVERVALSMCAEVITEKVCLCAVKGGEILTALLCKPWAVTLLLCAKAAEDESVIQEVAYSTAASCGMRSGHESFQSRRC